ncbi:hypothetical protein BCR34DRAFT_481829, partial [Clohesyomyces aquaticus]
PLPPPSHLYKILPSAPPTPLPHTLPLSDLDRTDGFIHLSTSSQVPGTAEKFFAEFEELWLLKINYKELVDGSGELKWEEVGRGCFAHLYGMDLGAANVKEVVRAERGEGWGGLVLEW